ncbi:MAG TPA: gamma-glutamyl-gamma-aminobutyrate hydrolase family protein [Catenuloplanes sp.]|jgi:putative glutamine amidotransferase
MRPVVGITSYVEPASWGVWHDVPAALLPYTYVQMVTAAGGRAVVLPPDGLDADVLAVLDALVLAGGADLHPDLYGQPLAPLTDSRPERDAGELTLVRAALERDLPLLGVCRGMQLLTVAAGGSLHQHLPDVVGHEKHRPAPGVYGSHCVRFAEGSRIAALMGEDTEVNAYHHQGVADPGSLLVTGWADDGVVEAVEDPERRFLLGVQWHPEAARDVRLFQALVSAALVPAA